MDCGKKASLVGTPFPDAEFGWCVILQLGVGLHQRLRHGVPIVYYSRITSSGSCPRLFLPGFYSLEEDVLSWLRIVSRDYPLTSSLTVKSLSYDGLLFPPHDVVFAQSQFSDDLLEEGAMNPDEELMIENLCKATDKFEAAVAMQPEDGRQEAVVSEGVSPAESHDSASLLCPSVSGRGRPLRPMLLSPKQVRRVMAARETLFKFGTFVPRNDREANASPEAHRWKAGRDLEWLRLNEQGTFEIDWDLDRVRLEHPEYKKADIGHCFYVYDYKFSGEHRVRLVFDGSRQSPDTYTETYAPTARQESVRLFHVITVEESYEIGQYDVPQAFLKAFMDHVIFAYPPNGQATFDGQLLNESKTSTLRWKAKCISLVSNG